MQIPSEWERADDAAMCLDDNTISASPVSDTSRASSNVRLGKVKRNYYPQVSNTEQRTGRLSSAQVRKPGQEPGSQTSTPSSILRLLGIGTAPRHIVSGSAAGCRI